MPRRRLEVEIDVGKSWRFLDKHILGVADFGAYVETCGGPRRLQELRRQELLLDRGR